MASSSQAASEMNFRYSELDRDKLQSMMLCHRSKDSKKKVTQGSPLL